MLASLHPRFQGTRNCGWAWVRNPRLWLGPRGQPWVGRPGGRPPTSGSGRKARVLAGRGSSEEGLAVLGLFGVKRSAGDRLLGQPDNHGVPGGEQEQGRSGGGQGRTSPSTSLLRDPAGAREQGQGASLQQRVPRACSESPKLVSRSSWAARGSPPRGAPLGRDQPRGFAGESPQQGPPVGLGLGLQGLEGSPRAGTFWGGAAGHSGLGKLLQGMDRTATGPPTQDPVVSKAPQSWRPVGQGSPRAPLLHSRQWTGLFRPGTHRPGLLEPGSWCSLGTHCPQAQGAIRTQGLRVPEPSRGRQAGQEAMGHPGPAHPLALLPWDGPSHRAGRPERQPGEGQGSAGPSHTGGRARSVLPWRGCCACC